MDDPLERFAGVYDQYYRNVMRYLLQHAEQGTAEDVASETFLIAWRRAPPWPPPTGSRSTSASAGRTGSESGPEPVGRVN
jgi:DNA-directed RNA polymerase specialized sigma24 family protein